MAFSLRHDHGGSGMSMGNMDPTSAGTGVPGYFYMQKMLWVVIGSAIAFATLINILNNALFWQRLRTGSAKPKSLFWSSFATATAIARELSSASLPTYRLGSIRLRSPLLGRTAVVLSWLIVTLVFCFYRYNTEDQWSWENIAYRCGCIAQAQLPLVFLLAGKQNIIGYLIGSSYERLNWIHRWVARILWLTVTLHMAFWFRSWARYAYILTKIRTDSMTQTGLASWAILTFILLTSFLPVRRLSYEVFVTLHLVLFAGLTGAIYIHTDYGKGYTWACVGIFFLDRVLRGLITLWSNFSFLHGKRGFLANEAILTPLPGNVTRIKIDHPVVKWQPGQHMFLSCHSVAPLQTHPFTAASLPSDGKLEFLVQAQTGGTRRIHRWASKSHRLPAQEMQSIVERKYVGIEGPYGSIRPLRQFDSIIFFAGSTGASFTTPLMRDVVRGWNQSPSRIVTKRIKFIWVIKSKDRLCWFEEQLQQAMLDVAALREGNHEPELDISVYITCDEKLEEGSISSVCAPPSHGNAQIYDQSSIAMAGGEKKITDPDINVTNVSSSSSTTDSDGGASNGGCCCKIAVDEDGVVPVCCCKRTTSPPASISLSSSITNEKPTPRIFTLYTGRPKVLPLIRKSLEEAEGESAVVVCGPQGLQDDVRHSVVYLSDERAVHKGTGAQAVYLHVEGFCY